MFYNSESLFQSSKFTVLSIFNYRTNQWTLKCGPVTYIHLQVIGYITVTNEYPTGSCLSIKES